MRNWQEDNTYQYKPASSGIWPAEPWASLRQCQGLLVDECVERPQTVDPEQMWQYIVRRPMPLTEPLSPYDPVTPKQKTNTDWLEYKQSLMYSDAEDLVGHKYLAQVAHNHCHKIMDIKPIKTNKYDRFASYSDAYATVLARLSVSMSYCALLADYSLTDNVGAFPVIGTGWDNDFTVQAPAIDMVEGRFARVVFVSIDPSRGNRAVPMGWQYADYITDGPVYSRQYIGYPNQARKRGDLAFRLHWNELLPMHSFERRLLTERELKLNPPLRLDDDKSTQPYNKCINCQLWDPEIEDSLCPPRGMKPRVKDLSYKKEWKKYYKELAAKLKEIPKGNKSDSAYIAECRKINNQEQVWVRNEDGIKQLINKG